MTFRTLTAKYPGTCKRCRQPFEAGTTIRYGGPGATWHLASACPGSATQADAQDASPAPQAAPSAPIVVAPVSTVQPSAQPFPNPGSWVGRRGRSTRRRPQARKPWDQLASELQDGGYGSADDCADRAIDQTLAERDCDF